MCRAGPSTLSAPGSFVRTLAANEGANFAVPNGKATIVTPVNSP